MGTDTQFLTRPNNIGMAPDRAAQGKARTRHEGWPGAIAYRVRDHCHPAHV
jgi:hypothetical protein